MVLQIVFYLMDLYILLCVIKQTHSFALVFLTNLFYIYSLVFYLTPCSPLITTPISCFPFRTWIITVMSSSEVSSSIWIISFNFHIWVPKVHFYYITFFIFNIHRTLFTSS